MKKKWIEAFGTMTYGIYAYRECTVKAAYKPGNHTLFIGEVVDAGRFSNDGVLTTLDYRGQYLGRD